MIQNGLKIILVGFLALAVSGCGAKAPVQPIVKNENHVYQTDQKIKEAIVILTKKVGKLEASEIKAGDGNGAITNDKLDELNNRLRLIEEDVSKAVPATSVSPKPNSTCSTVVFAMRTKGSYKAKTTVNVRACPMMESAVIGQIKINDEVKFEGCDKYGWCKLKGQDGYVSGRLFEELKNAAAQKETIATTSATIKPGEPLYKSRNKEYKQTISDYIKD